MKAIVRKMIALFLLLTVLLQAVSCKPEPSGVDQTSVTDPVQTNPSVAGFCIAAPGNTRFQVVYPGGSKSDRLLSACAELAGNLESIVGNDVKFVSDHSTEREYEILIGATRRDASAGNEELKGMEWRIALVDTKLVISGGSESAILEAIAYFQKQYFQKEGVYVPVDLLVEHLSNAIEIDLAQASEDIKISGRHTVEKNGITCDWSASGIEFEANCSGTVQLQVLVTKTSKSYENYDAYFAVYVDGVRQAGRIMAKGGESVVTLVENLEAGSHRIKLVKLNHVVHSNAILEKLYFTEGTLGERPADRECYLEFVGDSITCGYGLSDTPSNLSHGADATKSYAYVCAEALEADYAMISVSGHTLALKNDASVPYWYYPYINRLRSQAMYDFKNARQPDAVVVNLGTNDYNQRNNFGITEEVFCSDLKAWLESLRSCYAADTPIVFVTNTMNDGYANVIETVCEELGGESRGYYVYTALRNNDALDGHPSAEAMKQVGNGLADFLKSIGIAVR